jgi:hypothetical protein
MPEPTIDASKTDVAAWRRLLEVLDDAELERYGAIALDQHADELRLWWAQALAAVGALAAAIFAARGLMVSGLGRIVFLALGFSAALSYWPYRSAKTRALWWSHYVAVLDEQAKRASRSPAAANAEPQPT